MSETSRYEILDAAHGEGGFGRVARGKDKDLERMVAIKTLNMLDDEESRARFRKEARVLARMSHPNVPAIYDVHFEDSRMQIYFEFLEGTSLCRVISENAFPSMDEARRWFSQVASALEHAHGLGIIHRDVKPENIIISEDRLSAYLVDFGIALAHEDAKQITAHGYVIGTPAYMSPEQREGADLTPASDIYSLGLTLFETLSGHLPEPGASIALSEENEAIPPAVDDLIKQCLTRDVSRRVASGKDFGTKLRSAFRTDMPFSRLLTDARLHELHAALSGMSTEEFHAKPKGQRLALLMRLKDLLRSSKSTLIRPAADMLALMIRLAAHEGSAHYPEIIRTAFEWGFNRQYGPEWHGDQDIRNALIEVTQHTDKDVHDTVTQGFIQFLENKSLDKLAGWYMHDLRLLVKHLLANPHCEKSAEQLADFYDKMNMAGH